jgi:DNA-binding transcriptional LysR family regulator
VQSRSSEVVRGVADGRLDIGIVRQDALSPAAESLPLTSVGYSLFLQASLVPKGSKARVASLLATLPVAMLLPGGRFQTVLDEWLAAQEVLPNVVARVSSFLAAASLVDAGQAAAVLPDLAAAGFHEGKVLRKTLSLDYQRELALVSNPRGLDRAGFGEREVKGLARVLKRG